MTPAFCKVRHDPENGTYGDCLRACVASLVDMPTEDVEHFYRDGCDGPTGQARMLDWLRGYGKTLFFAPCDGNMPLEAVLEFLALRNPDTPYMLLGRTAFGEDHCVIGRGGKIVHNPAWYGGTIVNPLIGEDGTPAWLIAVVVEM